MISENEIKQYLREQEARKPGQIFMPDEWFEKPSNPKKQPSKKFRRIMKRLDPYMPTIVMVFYFTCIGVAIVLKHEEDVAKAMPKKKCTGYTRIEYDKIVTCYGDTLYYKPQIYIQP